MSEQCTQCGSNDTRSGASCPARCLNCGAIEDPFGEWYYDSTSKEYRNKRTNNEMSSM